MTKTTGYLPFKIENKKLEKLFFNYKERYPDIPSKALVRALTGTFGKFRTGVFFKTAEARDDIENVAVELDYVISVFKNLPSQPITHGFCDLLRFVIREGCDRDIVKQVFFEIYGRLISSNLIWAKSMLPIFEKKYDEYNGSPTMLFEKYKVLSKAQSNKVQNRLNKIFNQKYFKQVRNLKLTLKNQLEEKKDSNLRKAEQIVIVALISGFDFKTELSEREFIDEDYKLIFVYIQQAKKLKVSLLGHLFHQLQATGKYGIMSYVVDLLEKYKNANYDFEHYAKLIKSASEERENKNINLDSVMEMIKEERRRRMELEAGLNRLGIVWKN